MKSSAMHHQANKVIFLDIDGVLVTWKSMQLGLSPIFKVARFDFCCVGELNRITYATGAEIVISSSWRHWNKINSYMVSEGVCGEIRGKTPLIDAPGVKK